MSAPIDGLQGFYVTEDDGYTALSYYPDPDDETTGELVMFIDAGDTLVEIVTAALNFTPGQDK